MVLSPLQLAASSLHTLEAPLVKELGGVFLEDVLVLCSALPFIPVLYPVETHWIIGPCILLLITTVLTSPFPLWSSFRPLTFIHTKALLSKPSYLC